MKKINTILIISSFVFLIGCQTIKPETRNINIDASLMQECEPLPPLVPMKDGRLELGELMLDSVQTSGMYEECAAGKKGLIRAVEKVKEDNK